MDITTLTSLISSVGFPIACCIYLIYANEKISERHQEEVEKLREAVDNNTTVMIKLCAKLGVDYDN